VKTDQENEQYKKFLGMFKQLHINIPFAEALAQMPNYTKFLKDLLINKRKLEESAAVVLDANCSAVLQKNMPSKRKDPGSFIIQCNIGNLGEEMALADLGASINIMPYTFFQKLGLGEPRPTQMTLQLADRPVRHPMGIVEDVLVKVDKYIFPVDFVVLDVDEDVEVPLIFRRPFLRTSKALIDMDRGELTLRVGDDKLTYRLAEAMRHSFDFDDTLYYLDTTDDLIDECMQEMLNLDPYEGWPDQDEEMQEKVHSLGPVKEEITLEPGLMKKLRRRIKRARRRHNKCPKDNGDERQRRKGVSPTSGNAISNSPSSLRKLCHVSFQVVGKRATSIHEPQ